MKLEELVDAGFAEENWPQDIAMPGEENISAQEIAPKQFLYRYEADGHGQEVLLDSSTINNHAEGVCFMLNQFAYLWRTNKAAVQIQPDGSARRINF